MYHTNSAVLIGWRRCLESISVDSFRRRSAMHRIPRNPVRAYEGHAVANARSYASNVRSSKHTNLTSSMDGSVCR